MINPNYKILKKKIRSSISKLNDTIKFCENISLNDKSPTVDLAYFEHVTNFLSAEYYRLCNLATLIELLKNMGYNDRDNYFFDKQ